MINGIGDSKNQRLCNRDNQRWWKDKLDESIQI